MQIILRKMYNKFTSDKNFSEILTGSVWALAAQVLATGLGLVTSILIARIYGAGMVGVVAMIQSFLMFTTIVTVLGTNTSILRLIPEHVSKYSVTSAFWVYRKTMYFVGAFSILVSVLLFFASDMIATKIFVKPNLAWFFALASGLVFFRSLMDLNTQAVRGLRLIRTFAFMQVLPSAAILLALVAITFLHGGNNSPVYAQMVAWIVTALAGTWIIDHFFQKLMKPEDLVQSMPLSKILRISSPMFMTSSMQFITGQTGVVLLGIFSTEAEVGHYAMAVKLATVTSFVLNAINSMAAPKFSDLYSKGEMDELFYVAQKSTRLIFWTTVPLLFVLLTIGKPLLAVLFGQDFTVAYPAMVLLVIGQFINSISGSTGYFMNMIGHQKVLRNVMLVAGFFNLVLSLMLIPRFGIVGAAFAGMICLMSWNIYILFYIKRKYNKSIAYVPFCGDRSCCTEE